MQAFQVCRRSALLRAWRSPTPLSRATVARSGIWLRHFRVSRLSLEQADKHVTIGDVTVAIHPAKNPQLVPRGHLVPDVAEAKDLLRHLRWMMQKDLLKQDMFLLGPPGPERRWLALQFCELTGKEMEYVPLSRDTTEADIKQRREIVGGTAVFVDQAPVRAAIHGRVLVLDGLEKAERNVLPTLNNLLENREMSLDDGRFLMSPARYDALMKEGHTEEELSARRIVRVHPAFRVIALGIPVPPYPGRTLDPPLRSRFQARSITPPAPGALLGRLSEEAPGAPSSSLEQLVSVAETLRVLEEGSESGTGRIPHFPFASLSHLARVASLFPEEPVHELLARAYPYFSSIPLPPTEASHQETSQLVLQRFNLKRGLSGIYKPTSQDGLDVSLPGVSVRFSSLPGKQTEPITLPTGGLSTTLEATKGFVETEVHAHLLTAMMQDHAVGRDFCLVGGKGSGKSLLAREFATRLGYALELFPLYKDMTARDLLQRRSTNEKGDTIWEDSPLVTAAKEGKIVVLDGIHRLSPDTLSVLQRLVQERELDLYDGSTLRPYDQHQQMTLETGEAYPVHPSFRIIALANPPAADSRWLTSETLALFSFHYLPPLRREAAEEMVAKLFPRIPENVRKVVMNVYEALGEEQAQKGHKRVPQNIRSQSSAGEGLTPLSPRQLLRICRHLSAYPEAALPELPNLVGDAMMSRFLPSSSQIALRNLLERAGVPVQTLRKKKDTVARDPFSVSVADGILDIGGVTRPLETPTRPELVPDPVFFDIPQHISILRSMLQDLNSGERHLLLIGNQGVGKNKLADRLLALLKAEREYIQLHRDTTLQSLTLVPNLKDGRISWEDSPLVRAVSEGRTLVVDEADKAPLEVVCVLKSLVEDGEMLLGDGRRILHPSRAAHEPLDDQSQRILIHPNFKMIVLANRPGFPFLGNNFFREIGDIFCSHTIDNPDRESERQLLRSYAPDVKQKLIDKICDAFRELRALVEEGALSYPFSVREAVAVCRHLQSFPADGVVGALSNVLAFDFFDFGLRKRIEEVFHKHEIPLSFEEHSKPTVKLAKVEAIPEPELAVTWRTGRDGDDGEGGGSAGAISARGSKKGRSSSSSSSAPSSLHLEGEKQSLKFTRLWFDPPTSLPISIQSSRLREFSEQTATFSLPLRSDRAKARALLHLKDDDSLHILTNSPLGLHSISLKETDQGERRHSYIEFDPSYSSPQVVCLPLQKRKELALYFADSHFLLLLDPLNCDGVTKALDLRSLSGGKRRGFGGFFPWNEGVETDEDAKGPWRLQLISEANENVLLRYREGGRTFDILNIQRGEARTFSLPSGMHLERIEIGSEKTWLLHTSDPSTSFWMTWEGDKRDRGDFLHHTAFLTPMTAEAAPGQPHCQPSALSVVPTPSGRVLSPPHLREDSEARCFSLPTSYFAVGLSYPVGRTSSATENWEHTRRKGMDIFLSRRQGSMANLEDDERLLLSRNLEETPFLVNACALPVGKRETEKTQDDKHRGQQGKLRADRYRLEVISPAERTKREIPLPSVTGEDGDTSRYRKGSRPTDALVGVAELNDGSLVTLQENGLLSFWQLDSAALDTELATWREMFGLARSEDSLSLTFSGDGASSSSIPRTGLDAPKHGKEDEKNEPHVGGNTWAGGTGGSDTAGLGGRGGPYRLDKGHKVHQVSQAYKDQVSEEAKERARKMAEEALQKRLKDIKMTGGEWETYSKYLSRISDSVSQLRLVLETAEARARERQWVRHQTAGELDDTKLVDGVTGEKTIYKRRGEEDSPLSFLAPKPKRLLFVMDVSGSMYRFNGQDGRLERMLESAMMLMESLEGFDSKFVYSIVGHSGDSPAIPFVDWHHPPANRKERLKVLQEMVAHSQFCQSGDFTLEAAQRGMREVLKEEGDDYFVFVLSDANLERYGIRPQQLGKILVSDPRVKAYSIFIASLAKEAESLLRALPRGKGFVCLDTNKLPSLFKTIFTSQVLE